MKEPSPREKRITYIAACIASAAREMEMDWPRSRLDDPMLTGDKFIMFKSRVLDTEAIRQGQKIIEGLLVDAEGFGTLFALSTHSPKAFKAIVNLAAQELAREPEQVAA